MWETEWAIEPLDFVNIDSTIAVSTVNQEKIESAYLLYWGEHCVECVFPDCYKVCPLYVSRRDRRCARFRYGIFPNFALRGTYNYGAEIHFRRWGKLESTLNYGFLPLNILRYLDIIDRYLSKFVKSLANLFEPLDKSRKIDVAYNYFRYRILRMITSKNRADKLEFTYFIIEAWNLLPNSVRLIIECWQKNIVKFRTSLLMTPGYNIHYIPLSSMNIDLNELEGRIMVYPDHNVEAHLVFTWLDIVLYKELVRLNADHSFPAPKVKCVAWDLDNVIWKGILIEDSPDVLEPQPNVLKLISDLDKRGVLQTIVSKNEYTLAWNMIKQLGIEDYFLYPAINWGTKSSNLQQISKELNINLDAFAFIDDSEFERSEVNHAFPQIRTYSEKEIDSLLELSEFDLPITKESKNRRQFYISEVKRKHIAQSRIYGDNYEEFLKSCQMKAEIFCPSDIEDIERCLELLQRSNQLNLSTYRYEKYELMKLLQDTNFLCLATSCQDRFGNYGIIGFASIKLSGKIPTIFDYVFSCRIAKKKVENAWFNWFNKVLQSMGFDQVRANFIQTERNGVLMEVLKEIGFIEIEQKELTKMLELRLDNIPPASDVVMIEERGVTQILRDRNL